MASLLAFDDVHSEGRADNTELAHFVVGVEAIVLERCNHRAGAESSEIAAFAAESHVEYGVPPTIADLRTGEFERGQHVEDQVGQVGRSAGWERRVE